MNIEEKPLRAVQIKGQPGIGNREGFFHRWSFEPNYYAEVLHSRTLALVELNDGVIRFVDPENIQFIEPYKPPKSKGYH